MGVTVNPVLEPTLQTVLVICADQPRLEAVQALLEPLAVAVLSAPQIETALTLLRQADPALVLLDLIPEAAPEETYCRWQENAGSAVPVIIITVPEAARAAIACLRRGAVDYLTCPFQPQADTLRLEARLAQPLPVGASRLPSAPFAEPENQFDTLFETLFEKLPVCCWVFNAQGIILRWNETCRRLFGWTAEEAVGKTMYELMVQPQNTELTRSRLAAVFKGESFSGLEYESRKADGSLCDMLVNQVPLFDANGQISMGLCAAQDITQRKQVERQLKEVYGILNSSPVVAFLWRNERGWPVEFVTDNVKNIFGYTSREFMSGEVAFASVVHPDDLSRVQNEVSRYSNEADRAGFTHPSYRIIDRDGSIKWIEDRTIIRRNEQGDISHYQGILTDVSERRQAEQAVKKYREHLEELVAERTRKLQESEDRFRNIVHSSPMGMYLYELRPNNRLVLIDSNPAADRMTGIANRDLIGKTVEEAFPNLARTEVPDRYREAAAQGVAWQTGNLDYKDDRINGAYDVFAFQTTPGRMAVMFLDVTERKKMELAIQKAQNKLESRINELSALNRITQAVSTQTDLPGALRTVATIITDLFDCYGTLLLRLVAEQTGLTVSAYHFTEPTALTDSQFIYLTRTVFPLQSPSGAWQAIQTGQTLSLSLAQSDPVTYPFYELLRAYQIQAVMLVPLLFRGKVTGAITIVSRHLNREFSAAEVTLAETIAGQLAGLIENTHLFEQEQKQRQLAESLREVALAISSNLSLDTMTIKILDQLHYVIDFDGAGIFLYKNGDLINYAGSMYGAAFPGDHTVLVPDDPTFRVIRTGKPCIVADIKKDPAWITNWKWEGITRIRGWMALPLIAGDKIVGALTVDSFQVNAYSEETVKIAEAFAGQAALAIQNARQFEDEQRQRRIAQSLQKVALALNSSLEQNTVLTQIMEQLQPIIPCDGFGIFLQEGDKLVLRAGSALAQPMMGLEIPLSSDNLNVQVFKTNQPALVADTQIPSVRTSIWSNNRQIRGEMCIPLPIGHKIIGTLVIGSAEIGSFSEDNVQIAQIFAAQAAIAIQNARLFQEIQEEKTVLEALSLNSPVATVLTDANFIIKSWNPAAERLFGYTQIEVLNRHIIEALVPPHKKAESDLLNEQINRGNAVRTITQRRHKSGSIVDTELLAVPIQIANRQNSILVLYHDLAEIKQREEALSQAKEAAESASKAKSSFLTNISHELRTPLNAILGFSQLLQRDESLTREQTDYLDIINRSGEHLLGLINDVLELSKIEAGRATLNWQTCHLPGLLISLEDMFHLKAAQKHLQLHLELNPALPPFIRTDQSKLRQVLINLLNNAIKFTDEGSVTLRVGIFPHSTPDPNNPARRTLYFSIEDTGIGLSPEEIKVLFDSFVQTKEGRYSREGFGLGLPISRQFVRLLGGEISVESNPGQGSTFSFTIETEAVQGNNAQSIAPPDQKVVGLQAGQPTYRLLVIDDQWENYQLLSRLLTPLGFEVKGANNGQEGLELWRTWQPQLIWMDLRMPVMNGYETTRQIKSTEQGEHTIVIALTASAMEEQRAGALSAGCDGYVRKPFREAEILDILAQRLGVRYEYAREVTPVYSAEETETRPATPGSSSTLVPTQLKIDLGQATVQGNFNRMLALIEEIRLYNPEMANTLKEMVNRFAYDQVLSLLKQSIP